MIRRPKAVDTEQDILAFQESFLSSRSSPSASVVGGSKAGNKRPQVARSVLDRDVVRLRTSGASVTSPLEEVHRPSKRSRFKERRAQNKNTHDDKVFLEEEEVEEDDPYEAMDRHDTHITKVLASIQEHDLCTAPPPAVVSRAKYGFPLVRRLDQQEVTPMGSSLQGTTPTGPSLQEATPMAPPPPANKPKKSLFAQQFESHTLEYFGVELVPGDLGTPPMFGPIQKDEVNRVTLTPAAHAPGRIAQEQEGEEEEEEEEEEEGEEADTSNSGFASEASRTWNTFLRSMGGVVSGEGLVSSGLTPEAARQEVTKIDQENAKWLSQFSEQEILEQQEKIKNALGENMLAFLQARKKKPSVRRPGEEALVQQTDAMEWDSREDVTMETKIDAKMDAKVDDAMKEKARMSKGTVAPEGWLHMDVVEKEKLEWTSEAPVDTATSQRSPKEVRFSLEGLVIPRGTHIPTHFGLHHHGDEPEAAGYTLAELVHLSRSAVLQQRVFALQTLARIIQRATLNEYGDIVEPSVVQTLLEAGVPPLLRYTLDEQNEAVVGATVDCLHGILVSPLEEQLLDDYCYCYRGTHLPALIPRESVWGGRRHEEEEEEEEEETDAAVLQRDLIEGLVRVKLLPRLRYILEVCRPNQHVVSAILEVLIRVCRHSLQAASEVLSCPRLMDVVFGEFLPITWEDSTSVYGRPHPLAMRLVRTLTSAGRHLTSNLIGHHKLMDVIIRYTIPHPTDMHLLTAHDAYALGDEGLRTWGVVLSYGLGTEAFDDTYAMFIKQLQSMASTRLTSLGAPELRRVAAMVGVMESAVNVAGFTPEMLRVEGSNARITPPSIVWPHASGLLTPALHCLSTWLDEVVDGGSELEKTLCLSRLLHLVATYFVKLSEKTSGCTVESLEVVEEVASGVLTRLTCSPLFAAVLQGLRAASGLANTSLRVKRDLSSLPSHSHLLAVPKVAIYGKPCMEMDDLSQLGRRESACVVIIDMVHGYLRLCSALTQLHRGLLDKATSVLCNPLFQGYLEAIVLSHSPIVAYTCFFVGELQLLYLAVKVFVMRLEMDKGATLKEPLVQLFHHIAFKVLALCPQGMEYLISDITTGVIWHPYMFCELTSGGGSVVEGDMGGLSLRDPPTSVSKDVTSPPSSSGILSEAFQRLCTVPQVYLKVFKEVCYSEQASERSKHQLLCHPLLVDSVMAPSLCSSVLPPDWFLLPIITEYNRSLKLGSSVKTDHVAMVTTTLQTLFLLERLRPNSIRQLPTEAKLARLMCVFLIDGDLFLEKDVHHALSVLLRLYCTPERQESLDFGSPIPGLVSFYDLYSSLVAQFAAVSYGDPLFSSYLLLPLQQRFSLQFRRCLWDEQPTVLRALSLPLQQSPVPIDAFLYPVETDPVQVELYMAAIASGNVRPQWCPVLYLIAIHHVHSCVFASNSGDSAPTTFQRKLLQGILHVKSEETKRHLLLYAGPQAECALGFRLNAQMTTLQEARISAL